MLLDSAVPLPKPRKCVLWQQYSKLYYDTQVKPVYQVEWTKVNCSDGPKDASSSAIDVQSRVTKKLFLVEPLELQALMKQKAEDEHNEALKKIAEAAVEMESTALSRQECWQQ